VEITPELVVRLTSAYATTLNKGATVVTSRDHSRAARAFKRAVISALTSSALNVRDLEACPPPVTRLETARAGAMGGIMLRTVNNRLDDDRPTETQAGIAEALRRLGDLVSSSRATFGVRFDPIGERLSLVDDTGTPIDDDRALLVVLDLVAAERGSGKVVLPVTTTRIAEQVCRFHGVEVL